MRPGPVDRVVDEPGNEVPVAMVNRLAGGSAVVDDQVEAVGPGRGEDGSGEPGHQPRRLGREVVGQVGQSRVVGLGHEQDMPTDDRVDVEEGDRVVGLEHLGRGDLAPDDLAEEAGRVVRVLAHVTPSGTGIHQ